MKRILLILVLALVFSLTACTGDRAESTEVATLPPSVNESEKEPVNNSVNGNQNSAVRYSPITVAYDSDDLDSSWDNSAISTITLEGDSIESSGDGSIYYGEH